jgi:ABC-2 type transport system permease protein
MAVLVVALLILQAFGVIPLLPLVLVFMVLLAIFASGLAMVASIVNVYFRDMFHLVSIVLQFWFYLTPILYPVSLVETQSAKLGGLAGTGIELIDLYRLNPMESFIAIFRNLLYDNRLPDLGVVLTAVAWAALAAVVGFWLFAKREKHLAELL